MPQPIRIIVDSINSLH